MNYSDFTGWFGLQFEAFGVIEEWEERGQAVLRFLKKRHLMLKCLIFILQVFVIKNNFCDFFFFKKTSSSLVETSTSMTK